MRQISFILVISIVLVCFAPAPMNTFADEAAGGGYQFTITALPSNVIEIDKPSEGMIAFKDGFGKFGYLNEKFEVVIEAAYDEVYPFSEGLACVEKEGKLGFIDKSGNIVIPIEFNTAYDFSPAFTDGLACVKKGVKYGLIDNLGHVVLPIEYDVVDPFYEGMARIGKGGMFGYIDKKANIVIPIEYDDDSGFSFHKDRFAFKEGLVLVNKKDGKYGFIDKNGAVAIPFEYDDAYAFYDGLASVKKDGKYGVIDKNGTVVIDFEYTEPIRFYEGLAFVTKDNDHDGVYNKDYTIFHNKYGAIDKTGKVIIDFTISEGYITIQGGHGDNSYKNINYLFSDGLAAVRIGDKWGYMNTQGGMVIEPQYNIFGSAGAQAFSNGYAKVAKEDKWGVIDKQGNYIANTEYNSIKISDDYITCYGDNGEIVIKTKTGEDILQNQDGQFVDKDGNKIVEQYDNGSLKPYMNNMFIYKSYEHMHIFSIATPPKIVGEVVRSDISANINTAPIPSYNIDGNTAIIAEDLADYGFDVTWDEFTRTLSIKQNKDKPMTPIDPADQRFEADKEVGAKIYDIYSSDIAVYLDGVKIESYNINGRTAIYFDDLGKYGDVIWDKDNRSISINFLDEN